jgi:hypothetical protein
MLALWGELSQFQRQQCRIILKLLHGAYVLCRSYISRQLQGLESICSAPIIALRHAEVRMLGARRRLGYRMYFHTIVLARGGPMEGKVDIQTGILAYATL